MAPTPTDLAHTPAASAPPGYTSNLVDPVTKNNTPGIVLAIVGMIISTAFLAMRIYTKAVLARIFGVDDILLILSWVSRQYDVSWLGSDLVTDSGTVRPDLDSSVYDREDHWASCLGFERGRPQEAGLHHRCGRRTLHHRFGSGKGLNSAFLFEIGSRTMVHHRHLVHHGFHYRIQHRAIPELGLCLHSIEDGLGRDNHGWTLHQSWEELSCHRRTQRLDRHHHACERSL